MDLAAIIGLKVVTVKGWNKDKRVKHGIKPEYILFDDGKTVLQLEEQDPYTFHDYAPSARSLRIVQDEEFWKDIMGNKGGYRDANDDL